MRQESPELPGERPQHGRPLVQGHGLPDGLRHRARQVHPLHVIEAERALAFEGPPRHPAKGTVGMGMTRLAVEAMVIILSLTVAAASGGAKEQAVERWKAVEVAAAANEADEALLGRALSLALDAEGLYGADAQVCPVE